MPQSLTNFDLMLKEFYAEDYVGELIKQTFPLFTKFKKSKLIAADGRRVIQPLHNARNVGVSSRAEGGVLPTAGAQGYASLTIPYRYTHARIQMSIQTIKQSRTDDGAFDHVIDTEIAGAAKDGIRDLSRQLQGFGRGDLCIITDTNASLTHNLANGQGVADNDILPGRFLRSGMIVAAIKADNTVDFIRTVDSVSADLTQVVFTATVTPAEANEKLVRASTATGTAAADVSFNNEVMGLLGMIDDGTFVSSYFSNTRSSTPKLNAFILDLAEGNLSLDAMQRCFDGVDQQSDGKVEMMMAHHYTRREYLNLLQVMKRYVNEKAMSPDGGWKGAALGQAPVEFNEVPIIADRDVPIGVMHGVSMSEKRRYSLCEGEWADDDGRVMLRLSTTDEYEGRLRVFFGNFADLAPNANFSLRNVNINGTQDAIQVAD